MPATSAHNREAQLAEAFVWLADSLVEGFDVIELLDELTRHCIEFLDVDAAGLLLTDRRGRLNVVAASTEQSSLAGLFAVQAVEGPSLDCFRLRRPVLVSDLEEQPIRRRWPHFVEVAQAHGFQAAHSLPLRLRTSSLGALTLFATTATAMSPSDLRIGQALADTATIAILQQRSIADHNHVVEQLQRALTSRLVIEQAKARLAERRGIPLDAAFSLLRTYARAHSVRLSDLARVISTDTESDVLRKFEVWADESSESRRRS